MDEGTLQLLIHQAPTAILALIWLALFLGGKIHSDAEYGKLEAERDYWREAYEKRVEALQVERRIVNETAQAGQVNNQLLSALVNVATGRKTVPDPGLAPEDLGL